MDHDPHPVRVENPGGRSGEPSLLVALIVSFLLVALLKPWLLIGVGADHPESAGRAAIRSGTERPTDAAPQVSASPAPLDPNAMACLTDEAEQVVILERWAGHEVRSWVAAAGTTASGPLDVRLVPVPFFSIHVIGLGICAPRAGQGGDQPAARILDVQSIVGTDSGPRAVDLGEPDPLSPRLTGPEPALLYGPPVAALPQHAPTARPGLATPSTGPAVWPTGSYGIAFRFLSDGPRVVRWLRLDLIQGAGTSN